MLGASMGYVSLGDNRKWEIGTTSGFRDCRRLFLSAFLKNQWYCARMRVSDWQNGIVFTRVYFLLFPPFLCAIEEAK